MKPLSEKARLEIYEKAKANIANGEGNTYLCGQLSNLIFDRHGIYISFDDVLDALPEFKLFEPTPDEMFNHRQVGITWFGSQQRKFNGNSDEEVKIWDKADKDIEYNQMERMLCLDLCILLLTDPLVANV